jgi:hypothetical protein
MLELYPGGWERHPAGDEVTFGQGTEHRPDAGPPDA